MKRNRLDPELASLKKQMKQDRKEIIAAINFYFGKRVKDLETGMSIVTHRLDQVAPAI